MACRFWRINRNARGDGLHRSGYRPFDWYTAWASEHLTYHSVPELEQVESQNRVIICPHRVPSPVVVIRGGFPEYYVYEPLTAATLETIACSAGLETSYLRVTAFKAKDIFQGPVARPTGIQVDKLSILLEDEEAHVSCAF